MDIKAVFSNFQIVFKTTIFESLVPLNSVCHVYQIFYVINLQGNCCDFLIISNQYSWFKSAEIIWFLKRKRT